MMPRYCRHHWIQDEAVRGWRCTICDEESLLPQLRLLEPAERAALAAAAALLLVVLGWVGWWLR